MTAPDIRLRKFMLRIKPYVDSPWTMRAVWFVSILLVCALWFFIGNIAGKVQLCNANNSTLAIQPDGSVGCTDIKVMCQTYYLDPVTEEIDISNYGPCW